MPVLHYRLDGGSPFIRTAPLNHLRERIFLIWTPDAFAMRRLDEEGICNEGDWIEWELFFNLRAEDHIVPGAECPGGLEPQILDLVEQLQHESRIHFRNVQDAEGEDFNDLKGDLEDLLGLINTIRNHDDLKSQRYLSLAQSAGEMMQSQNPEISAYGRHCRDRIIQSIHGNQGEPLHVHLRAHFHLNDEEWGTIRNSNPRPN
jgi:hypothetical protein